MGQPYKVISHEKGGRFFIFIFSGIVLLWFLWMGNGSSESYSIVKYLQWVFEGVLQEMIHWHQQYIMLVHQHIRKI